MVARLYDAALFQHKNGLGMQDGREPVRNQDRDARALRRQAPHGVGDLLFGQRVQCRCCLVKDQERRLAQQRAGNRQPLLFTTGQAHAHLADGCVQPFRGLVQQVGASRLLHGGDDFSIAGIGFDHPHVLAQAAGKQVRLLRHKTDLAAHLVVAQLGGGNAVVENLTTARRVQTHQQLDQRRLARAGRPDEGHRVAQFGTEADTIQRVVRRALVFEHHVAETHLAHRPDVNRIFGPALDGFFHQRFKVEQRSLGLAPGHDDVAQLLQRRKNGDRNELHGNQFARAQHVLEDQPQQRKQDGQLEQTQRGALQKRQQADALDLLHLQRKDFLGLRLQSANFRKGQPQAFDQLDVAQRLGDETRVAVGLAHDRTLLALDLATQQTGQATQHHHANQKHRHQRPVPRQGIPDQEAHAHEGSKHGIDKGVDETLAVLPHFLQQ